MSGVWVFNKNGVARLVQNPGAEPIDGMSPSSARRKVLVHIPSNEVITSYALLERKLLSLGWQRYYDYPDLIQFHKEGVHIIILFLCNKSHPRANVVHRYLRDNKHEIFLREL